MALRLGAVVRAVRSVWPRLAEDGEPPCPVAAAADARAAAAAAELRRVRRRPADAPTLATVYVAGMSRDVRQHRMRALLADVTGVDVHSIVDVDRFGATTAVTVVAAAAEGFRSAVGKGRAATVLRLLPTADPWAPALLDSSRRHPNLISGAPRIAVPPFGRSEGMSPCDHNPTFDSMHLVPHFACRVYACSGAPPVPRREYIADWRHCPPPALPDRPPGGQAAANGAGHRRRGHGAVGANADGRGARAWPDDGRPRRPGVACAWRRHG
ncbi:hypothetical protein MMPV_009304 [Pyropia vietnamensis]